MSLDLSTYRSLQTNLFINLDIPGYQVLTFSDYHKSLTINGVAYTGLGQLLSVTNTTNNLRATPKEIVVGISGIPMSNINSILGNKVKGSKIKVYRGFFDPTTGILLPITGNPAGKFQGVVANFQLDDQLAMGQDTGTITLTLTCTSVVELLNNKISGRRTNSIDELKLYPNDHSMDRVIAIANSNYNFGAP